MNNKFTCLLLVLGMMSSSWAQTHRTKRAPQPSVPQGAVRADDAVLVDLEKEFFTAIREKDTDKLNGMLADDFAYVVPGQPEMTRDQYLKHVRGLPDTIEWLGADEMRVKILGEVGVVTGVRNTKIRNDSGTLVSSDSAFADIFKKNGEEWELVMVHAMDLPAPANSQVGK
jgi:ketosteroid isomerase-like protein